MFVGASSYQARGGDGVPGNAAPTSGVQGPQVGDLGAPGGNGQNVSSFSAFDGGDGAAGGLGGAGGLGAPGAAGAGGAGGTVKLFGSVTTADPLVVDTSGGSGGPGADAGGLGRLLLGSNTPLDTTGWNVTASTQLFAGTQLANPYVADSAPTPYLTDLVGGADIFGLLSYSSALLFSVELLAAASAAEADLGLFRIDAGWGELVADFAGYDLLLIANLSDQAIADPQLGVGAAAPLVPLQQAGFANRAEFGGGGPVELGTLAVGAVFATLIPEAADTLEFATDGNSAVATPLADGEILFATMDTGTVLSQTTEPAGPTDAGRPWQTVGAFTSTPEEHNLTVQMSRLAPGVITADAVRLAPIESMPLSLERLGLANTPLDNYSRDAVVPALVARGIDVRLSPDLAAPTIDIIPSQSVPVFGAITVPVNATGGVLSLSVDRPEMMVAIEGNEIEITNFNVIQGLGRVTVTVSAPDGRTAATAFDVVFDGGLVEGNLFHDLNGDGSRDLGEPDLAGWPVVLTPAGGSLSTDLSGAFRSLPIDNATAVTVSPELPPDWRVTTGPTEATVSSDVTTFEIGLTSTLRIAGPSVVDEGQPVHLTAQYNPPSGGGTPTYDWQVLRDGQPYATSGGPQSASSFGFTPDRNGSYDVVLTLQDGTAVIASTRITARNLAPSIDLGPDRQVLEGEPISLSASIIDPGPADLVASYAWRLIDAAGNTVQTAATPDFMLTIDDEGQFVVELTIADTGGALASDTLALQVQNAPVRLSLDPAGSVAGSAALVLPGSGPDIRDLALGEEIVLSGAFVDSGSDFWTGIADFGDGIVRPVLVDNVLQTFVARHTYTKPGTYLATITISDQDGGAQSIQVGIAVGIPRIGGVFISGSGWSSTFLNDLATTRVVDPQRGLALPSGPGQTASLGWSGIDRVSLQFTQDVSPAALDLLIARTSGSELAPSVSYSSATRTATWQLTQPLAGGLIGLQLADAVHDAATGLALDGEWTTGLSRFPSGDGNAAGDFVFSLFALPGDLNADRQVDAADRALLDDAVATGVYTALLDLNGDGAVDSSDQSLLSGLIGAPTLPGDYDLSGAVDQADYAVWKQSFGQTGQGLAADGNGDNVVDAADYSVWRDNLGSTSDVPMPGDYDRSGAVDQVDYAVWKQSFGQTGQGLAADSNGDNVVDAADYSVWRDNLGSTSDVPQPGDFDRSGTVDQLDYQLWKQSFGQTGANLPADANQDGAIDAADYTVWRDHQPSQSSNSQSGDFDGGGTVDQLDYQLWKQSFGQIGSNLPADANQDGTVDAGDYTVWRDHRSGVAQAFASVAVAATQAHSVEARLDAGDWQFGPQVAATLASPGQFGPPLMAHLERTVPVALRGRSSSAAVDRALSEGRQRHDRLAELLAADWSTREPNSSFAKVPVDESDRGKSPRSASHPRANAFDSVFAEDDFAESFLDDETA